MIIMRDYDAWVVITVMVVQNLRAAIAKKREHPNFANCSKN